MRQGDEPTPPDGPFTFTVDGRSYAAAFTGEFLDAAGNEFPPRGRGPHCTAPPWSTTTGRYVLPFTGVDREPVMTMAYEEFSRRLAKRTAAPHNGLAKGTTR